MNFIQYQCHNPRPFTARKTTEAIILHHAAAITCTPEQIESWHLARGFNGPGYNFFVRKDGTIYALRPVWASGAHTIGWNSRSIGICAEGNFELETMPEVQRKSIAEVIDYCFDQYGDLPVFGHKQKWPTACPGKNYPFQDIVTLAEHWDDKPVIPWPGRYLKLTKPMMRGTDIRAVQQRLNELGFNCGKTDGILGKNTDYAIRAFQRKKSLKVDGIVGPATWKALFE